MKIPSLFVATLVVFVAIITTGLAEAKKESNEKSPTSQLKNEVGNVAGEIDEDAQIEGVVVINGVVSIDGVRVPKGQRKFHSRSGKNYVIEWGRDGNVSVAER